MKNFKRVLAFLMAVVFCFALTMTQKVEASAEEKHSIWTVMYSGTQYALKNDTMSDWVSSFDFMNTYMKDGDSIVINANNDASAPVVQFELTKKVGDLVALNGAYVLFTGPYVERAYVAEYGTLVVNGDVGSAEVSRRHVLQISGNVDTFVAHYESSGTDYPVFAVTGTVKKANVNYTGDRHSAATTLYNIAKGKLVSNEKGVVSLKEGEYSLTPQAETPKKETGKQLDKVPATGAREISESFLFFMLSAAFALGAVICKKKIQ